MNIERPSSSELVALSTTPSRSVPPFFMTAIGALARVQIYCTMVSIDTYSGFHCGVGSREGEDLHRWGTGLAGASQTRPPPVQIFPSSRSHRRANRRAVSSGYTELERL